MNTHFTVVFERPEGYEDVHPQLCAEDHVIDYPGMKWEAADGNLIEQHDDLIEIAEMLYKECLAERDCFYENCSTQDGEVPDADDRHSLAEIDTKLDQARAVLDRHRQPQEAPELFPGTLEKLRGWGSNASGEQPAANELNKGN